MTLRAEMRAAKKRRETRSASKLMRVWGVSLKTVLTTVFFSEKSPARRFQRVTVSDTSLAPLWGANRLAAMTEGSAFLQSYWERKKARFLWPI